MTRETKIGLIVAVSFVCLVGIVVATRWRRGDDPKTGQQQMVQVPDNPPPTAGKNQPPGTSSGKGGVVNAEFVNSGDGSNPPPKPLPSVASEPNAAPVPIAVAPADNPAGPNNATPMLPVLPPPPVIGEPNLPSVPTAMDEANKIKALQDIKAVQDRIAKEGSNSVQMLPGLPPEPTIGGNNNASPTTVPPAPMPGASSSLPGLPPAPMIGGSNSASSSLPPAPMPGASSSLPGLPPAPMIGGSNSASSSLPPAPMPGASSSLPGLPPAPTISGNNSASSSLPPAPMQAASSSLPGLPSAPTISGNNSASSSLPPAPMQAASSSLPGLPPAPTQGDNTKGSNTLSPSVPTIGNTPRNDEPRPAIPAPMASNFPTNANSGGNNNSGFVIPSPNNNAVASYDVKKYEARAGDTFASIGRAYYGDEKYSNALLAYNREMLSNRNLTTPQPGQMVLLPPPQVLQDRYSTAIADNRLGLTGASPVSIQPPVPLNNKSFGPAPTPSSDLTKNYRVPAEGQMVWSISVQTMGDGNRWSEIYRLNPTINPMQPIPGGTMLRLPGNANVP